MEEKQKKGKLIPLIIFIIILLVALGVSVAYNYKLNQELISFKTEVENEIKILNEENAKEPEKIEEVEKEDLDQVEVIGLDTKYKELSKAAKRILTLGDNNYEITNQEKTLEYDLNGDEIKETIKLKTYIPNNEAGENAPVCEIHYNNSTIFSSDFIYNPTIYIVDLNKNDNYLDLVLGYSLENNGFFEYAVFKNMGNILKNMEYTHAGVISSGDEVDNYYEGRFYLNGENNFLLLNNVQIELNKIISNDFYEIKENKIINKSIDINTIRDEIFEFDKEVTNSFFSETKKVNYDRYISLKKGQQFKIIDWIDDGNGMKVELSNGKIGYIYPVHGYLAG